MLNGRSWIRRLWRLGNAVGSPRRFAAGVVKHDAVDALLEEVETHQERVANIVRRLAWPMENGTVGPQLQELVASPIPARVLDPGRKWDGGCDSLMTFCVDGNSAAVRLNLILDPSLDLELRDPGHGSSFLHRSCIFGHLDVARVLVEAGAEVDAVDKYGRSASR